MTLDPREAALALHRFGFGPRPGTIAAIASDPRGALLADLEAPNAGQIVNTDLPTSGAEIRAGFEFNAARLAQANQERRDSPLQRPARPPCAGAPGWPGQGARR